MVDRKVVLDELDFLTDRISTQVRTVSLSLIAVSWLFLGGGGNEMAAFVAKPNTTLLLISGAFCLIAIFSDYLQYVMGYLNTTSVLKQGGDHQFADGAFYSWRRHFFWIKQAFVVGGFVVFAWACVAALFASPQQPSAEVKPSPASAQQPKPQKKAITSPKG